MGSKSAAVFDGAKVTQEVPLVREYCQTPLPTTPDTAIPSGRSGSPSRKKLTKTAATVLPAGTLVFVVK